MQMKNVLIGLLVLVIMGQTVYIFKPNLFDGINNAEMSADLSTVAPKVMLSLDETRLISPDTAFMMMNSYLLNPRVYRNPSATLGVQDTFKGFRIKKANILDLWNESSLEYLYIGFGVDPADRLSADSLQKFTAYVFGLDSSMRYIKKRNKIQVYEYLTKCPTHCPQ